MCIAKPPNIHSWKTKIVRVERTNTSVLMAEKLSALKEECDTNECVSSLVNKPSYFKANNLDVSGGLVQLSECQNGGVLSVGPTTKDDVNSASLEFGKGTPVRFEIQVMDYEVHPTQNHDLSEHVMLKVIGGEFDGAYLRKRNKENRYDIARQATPTSLEWKVDTVGHLQDTGKVTLHNGMCLILTPTQNKHPPYKNKKNSESKSCVEVVEEARKLKYDRFFSIAQRARDCCAHLLEVGFILECS